MLHEIPTAIEVLYVIEYVLKFLDYAPEMVAINT